jgi:FdhD protein
VRRLKIIRIRNGQWETLEDLITEEISLALLAEHRRIAVLMCSPSDLEDLVTGFFYTNGFIQRADQIRRIVINRATWTAFIELAPEIDVGRLRPGGVIGSACAGGPVPEYADGHRQPEHRHPAAGGEEKREAAGCSVSSRLIIDLMDSFRKRSKIHRQTGGVHAAAIASAADQLVFREDIGRHNAVDKVIGACLAEDLPFEDKILLTSGRLSSEIIYKADACRLPIIVSRSAPTDRSISLARDRDITLVGFARGRRLNIYSASRRLFEADRGL